VNKSRTLSARGAAMSVIVISLGTLAGCGGPSPAAKADLPPPMVAFAPPSEQMVTRYEYATGRTKAIEDVEIRPRVNGYLKSIHFEPGKEVEKGQLLFEIDPEPYKADLSRAKAGLATAEAELSTAEAEVVRAGTRVGTTKTEYDREEKAFNSGAGSTSARDKAKGDFDEASATLRTAQAKVRVANAKIEEAKAQIQTAALDLSYCTIKAPIAGVVGDRLVTEGNLVTPGQANSKPLTTIVADEKMDVAFDVDENTFESIEQAVREGKIEVLRPGEIPAEVGLAIHGAGYPLKGFVNFKDNRIDAKTGTIRIKARFDNPRPANGFRVLADGMYTRVRVPIGKPVKSMLVPEAALGSDQGIKYLYIVGPENKVVRLDIETGALEGEMRVVESVKLPGEGKPRPLTASDRVIVTGLQRIHPGMIIDPKPVAK